MSAERIVRGIAGAFVLAGTALMVFHHPNWIYFILLVGVMQFQSGFTDRCPMLWLLEKLGFPRCAPKDQPEARPAASTGGVR